MVCFPLSDPVKEGKDFLEKKSPKDKKMLMVNKEKNFKNL